mgnify:CR=1 FL=1
MGRDHPDGTLQTIHAELIANLAVPVLATTEIPISRLGKATDSAQAYQTVLSYTVPAATIAILYGVELYSDLFAKTLWRLTIGGVVQWQDKDVPTALNTFFAEARLAAGTVILLEGKSSDGTAVTMWGSLEGKEIS